MNGIREFSIAEMTLIMVNSLVPWSISILWKQISDHQWKQMLDPHYKITRHLSQV